ncbi:MAG: hypothetical protein M4579_001533 [Chaenotheca gracillima]|nr:MAG: hypothetical protein M4579_001533 [Chaenotheca gracillima]
MENVPSPTDADSNGRRSLDTATAVESILKSGTDSPWAASPTTNAKASPLPSEHLPQPSQQAMASRRSLDMAPPPTPAPRRPSLLNRQSTASASASAHNAHTRRMSKRLSLSFPVHPNYSSRGESASSSASGTPVEATSAAAAAASSGLPENPSSAATSSTPASVESSGFLVALAAQERRVLELKDELRRAEGDLERLKKQWAMHEATRKRNEVRHVEQLQPMGNTHRRSVHLMGGVESSGEESSGSAIAGRLSREQERRKAALTSGAGGSGARNSQRKVISGQGHTRALSLLSPRISQVPTFPTGRTLGERKDDDKLEAPRDLARSSTVPSQPVTATPSTTVTQQDLLSAVEGVGLTSPQKDAILRSGRQMAEGLREGLWTFLDDLRQATVGDEAVHGKNIGGSAAPGTLSAATSTLTPNSKGARKQGSRSSLRSASGRPSPSPKPSSERIAKGSGHVPENKNANNDGDQSAALIDIGGTFWKEHDVDSVATPQSATVQSIDRVTAEDPDGWDNWDSPHSTKSPGSPRRHSDSSGGTGAGTSNESGGGTPRTSTSSSDIFKLQQQKRTSALNQQTTSASTPKATKDLSLSPTSGNPGPVDGNSNSANGIPWPSLAQTLSPGNLQRSASSLMRDWERSLSPSPSRVSEKTPGAAKAD